MENNQPTAAAAKPSRAMEILKRVPGGSKLIPVTQQQSAPVEAPSKPVEQTTTPPVGVKSDYDINPEAPVEEPKKDLIPKEFLPDDPTDEIDQLIDPKDTTGANFKKLRTKLKAVNQENRTNKEELATLRTKVKDYDEGLAVPSVTQEQRDRIAELEKYEKLFNFKGSPVYVEKFANPIREEQTKLAALATENDIDLQVLNAAFAAPTSAETNRILSQHFKDDIGALEAKSIFRNIKKIQDDAASAEKEIETSFTRMQQESDRIVQDKRQKANEVIVHVSKEAWSESLIELRKDPRFPEITYREGDTEHNEKYVRPILTKAGHEYGRIINVLAQHGLTELPRELSLAFAKMSQLAHLSAITAVQRDTLQARVNELENLMNTKKYLNRPSVNGTGGGSNTSGQGNSAVGAEKAGARVLQRVMNKK